MKQITIHIDGACSNNGKPNAIAGYGIVYDFGLPTQSTVSGLVESEQTNNAAELTAFVKAFEPLLEMHQQLQVTVYTDSMFLINGATKWINTWKLNGYKTSNKTPVANRELWEIIDMIMEHYKPTLVHVLGHSGDQGNELADSLAVDAVKQGKANLVSEKQVLARQLLKACDKSDLKDIGLIELLLNYLD